RCYFIRSGDSFSRVGNRVILVLDPPRQRLARRDFQVDERLNRKGRSDRPQCQLGEWTITGDPKARFQAPVLDADVVIICGISCVRPESAKVEMNAVFARERLRKA